MRYKTPDISILMLVCMSFLKVSVYMCMYSVAHSIVQRDAVLSLKAISLSLIHYMPTTLTNISS